MTASQRAIADAKRNKLLDAYAEVKKDAEARMKSGKGADGSGGRGKKKNPAEIIPEGLPETGETRTTRAVAVGTNAKYIDLADRLVKEDSPFIVNLARRHMDTHRWGLALKRVLEMREVKTGQGARNDKLTCATVAQVAEEIGVPKRTAFRRLAAARDYLSLPKKLQAAVDSGEKTVKEAKREVHARRVLPHVRKAAPVSGARGEGTAKGGGEGRR